MRGVFRMCGIAGWFGPGAAGDATTLLTALRHRGPDGEGAWHDTEGRAALVHTRLAILDLSDGGAQPMGLGGCAQRLTAHRHWLAFNGEIYNYAALRAELESAGEHVQGQSDTEVLLRLLRREGRAALPKLAGMFALASYDGDSGHGLLARDAFGIKPLYYLERPGGLLFASEVKALLPFVSDTSIDAAALRDTLMWGSVPEPATLFAGIRQLPAGCCLAWDGTRARMARWHALRFGDQPAPAEAIAATRAALVESIQRHLVSDVPVGIFLSGGLDSTAVVALAREVLGPGADLRTFAIGFDDPAYDESAIARRTAGHFGARHTEWRMTPAAGQAEIAGYLAAMDQPTIDGFNTWCVSRLARREGLKVVLSGLGGDELFAGYASFRQVPRLVRLHRWARPLRPLLSVALHRLPVGSR
jgi:asparagine synthase (glutamine-hydrolysing)